MNILEFSRSFWKLGWTLYWLLKSEMSSLLAFEKLWEHKNTLFKRRERFSRRFWKLKWNSKAFWVPCSGILKINQILKVELKQYWLISGSNTIIQAYRTIQLSGHSNLVSLSPPPPIIRRKQRNNSFEFNYVFLYLAVCWHRSRYGTHTFRFQLEKEQHLTFSW